MSTETLTKGWTREQMAKRARIGRDGRRRRRPERPRHHLDGGALARHLADREAASPLPAQRGRAGTRPGSHRLRRPARVGPERAHPGRARPGSLGPGGWAPHPVIGFVVGGSPNARIDAILREDKGFTYGIRSGFRPRAVGGLRHIRIGACRLDRRVAPAARRDPGRRGAGLHRRRGALGSRLHRQDRAGSLRDCRRHRRRSGHHGPRRSHHAVHDRQPARPRDGRPGRADAAWAKFVERAGVGVSGAGWTIIVVGDAAEHVEAIESLGLGAVTVVKDA